MEKDIWTLEDAMEMVLPEDIDSVEAYAAELVEDICSYRNGAVDFTVNELAETIVERFDIK